VAHVVLLALHGFGVDLGGAVAAGLAAKNLFGNALGLVLLLLGLIGLGLDEHLPEALGGDVLEALVRRSVPEDVGDRLAQLLDGDGESVRLVVLDHLEKGVTLHEVSRLTLSRRKRETY